jgi:hypothetical protein
LPLEERNAPIIAMRTKTIIITNITIHRNEQTPPPHPPPHPSALEVVPVSGVTITAVGLEHEYPGSIESILL